MFLVERKNTGDTILRCNDDTRAIRRNFSRVNPFFNHENVFFTSETILSINYRARGILFISYHSVPQKLFSFVNRKFILIIKHPQYLFSSFFLIYIFL